MAWDDSSRQQAQTWLSGLETRWATDEPENLTTEARQEIVAAIRLSLSTEPKVSGGDEATRYLERLAHHFSGEEIHFESPGQMHDFCDRIRRSVSLLLGELQDLLAGRKKVQNDWSLYSSTAMSEEQSLKTRDIRLGNIHGDLGKQLFDWRHPEATEATVAGLKSALEELKHHQLATMAGYERSVAEGTRAVMDRLDPHSIENEFLGAVTDSGEKRAAGWRRFLPFRGLYLWRLYSNRFEQITSEDARWYQRQFLPAFRQGYRDYMVGRMTASAAAQSPR